LFFRFAIARAFPRRARAVDSAHRSSRWFRTDPVPSPLHRSGCHNSPTNTRARVPHLPATHPCGANHCILVVRIVLSPGNIAAAGRSCSCTRPPTAYCVHDDCPKNESDSDHGAGVPVRVTVALQQVLRRRTPVSHLACWSRSCRRPRLYHITVV